MTDKQIEEAVRNGNDSIFDIACSTKAGSKCSGCRDSIQSILDTMLIDRMTSSSPFWPEPITEVTLDLEDLK